MQSQPEQKRQREAGPQAASAPASASASAPASAPAAAGVSIDFVLPDCGLRCVADGNVFSEGLRLPLG